MWTVGTSGKMAVSFLIIFSASFSMFFLASDASIKRAKLELRHSI